MHIIHFSSPQNYIWVLLDGTEDEMCFPRSLELTGCAFELSLQVVFSS